LRFSVTNHRVALIAHLATARAGTPRPGPGLVDVGWIDRSRLNEFTFSSPSRRLIAWLNDKTDRNAANGSGEARLQ
jgi:hypothetical protein